MQTWTGDDADLDDGEDLPKDSAIVEVAKAVAVLPAMAIGGVLLAAIAGMVALGFVVMGLAFTAGDQGESPFAATVVRNERCVESTDELIEATTTGDGISEIEPDANVDEADDDGQTALYCAAAHGQVDDVELLLENGADPNLEAAGGVALEVAVVQGEQEVVETLLAGGAAVDGGEPQAALARAIETRQTELVELLLDEGASPLDGIPLEMPNVADGRLTEVGEAELEPPESPTDPLVAVLLLSGELAMPPLHSAALADDAETTQLLIDQGAPVDQFVYAGITPLHAAVVANSPEAVRVLLEAGADPNLAPNGDTGSPLALAAALGREQIAIQMLGG